MQTSRILLGALAAPLLLLPACGGGNTPVADPPVAPSSSSVPTDPPKRESPEHFIRRWAAAEMKMENTGSASGYLAMSVGCDPCRKLASQVHAYYEAGGFVRWGGWKILSIEPYAGQPAHQFEVHSNSRPTSYRESSTSGIKHFAGGSITYVLALAKRSDGWVVTNKSELET